MKELTFRLGVDDLMEQLELFLGRIVREEIEFALQTSGSESAAITNSPAKDLMNSKDAAAFLGVSAIRFIGCGTRGG
jgi:hypothetical protein